MTDFVAGSWPPGRSLAGFSVGVIVRDSHCPLLAGNMQNATTFNFPVLYGIVEDVRPDELYSGAPELGERVLDAGRQLIKQGVKAIAGACGSFAYFQTLAASTFGVPTAMSVMVQLPFLLRILPQGHKIWIIFSSAKAFTERLRFECNIKDSDLERLVITEARDLPAFRDFLGSPSQLDVSALDAQLRNHALELMRREPAISMVVLQCSDLPPFASTIQLATRCPVIDGSLLVNWLHEIVVRVPYHGYV